jgi:hypothetical protein
MATKIPNPNVMTRIIFCFFGRRMLVRIGIGRKKIARSVMMLRGADDRYMVTIFVQDAVAGTGVAHAACTGWHWTMLRIVRASPPTFTMTRVAMVAQRKTLCVFDKVR